MRLLLAENLGTDADDVILFLEFLDHNGCAVGYLVRQKPQDLFTDHLRRNLSFRLVGGNILREEPNALVQEFSCFLHDDFHVLALLGAGGNKGIKIVKGRIFSDSLRQFFPINQIDLVQNENGRQLTLFQIFDNTLFRLTGRMARFGNHNGSICAAQSGRYGFHHKAAQLILRLMNTGGIHKYKLVGTLGQNTGNSVAGGLGFAGNDGHLFSQHSVHKGGFTYVGTAHNSNKSRSFLSCKCMFHSYFPSVNFSFFIISR